MNFLSRNPFLNQFQVNCLPSAISLSVVFLPSYWTVNKTHSGHSCFARACLKIAFCKMCDPGLPFRYSSHFLVFLHIALCIFIYGCTIKAYFSEIIFFMIHFLFLSILASYLNSLFPTSAIAVPPIAEVIPFSLFGSSPG